jgi:polysaccharide pyruvyl transferase WcaK-like protein
MNDNTLNILVFGYYFRDNFGDDLFKYTFEKYIFGVTTPNNATPKYNLIFKNIEDLDKNTHIYSTIDKVIIGGGDIINNFFLNDNNINLFRTYFGLENTQPIPIYFISVGLTYPGMISAMDIGDYFFMRNNTDYNLIKNRYTSKYTSDIPDIGFNLLKEPSLVNWNKPIAPVGGANPLKIGICIPYTWVAKQSNENVFLNQICTFVQTLASNKNYQITLLPFDTSIDPNNSDIILNKTIQSKIGNGNNNNIFYLNPQQNSNVSDMINYFKHFDLVFASRFHSVVLSIITNTPFISIYSTPKIYNLMNDIKIKYPNLSKLFVKLNLDENNVPLDLDQTKILESFNYILSHYNDITSDLNNLCKDTLIDVNKANVDILNLINNPSIYSIFRQGPPQYITDNQNINLVNKTITNVLKKVIGNISLKSINYILKGNPIINILPATNSYKSYQTLITEEILWNITGDPYAPYYYGLYNNILKNTFISQVQWIINDYYQNYYYKEINPDKITIINKNFQKLHRSGWQYIVDNIILQLNDLNTTKPLIIDTFIDKTFNWNYEFYSYKGVIPYKSSWVGFIHHTYSSYNNDYNCKSLFENSGFLNSLPQCKCLFVLSEYLKIQIEESLSTLNTENGHEHGHEHGKGYGKFNIPIINLVHPTDNPDLIFNWDLFMNNKNKQLIQIGNWMRNVFGIYRIELPNTSIIKQKSILQNNNSSNYFAPPNFIDTLKNQLNTTEDNAPNAVDVCRNAFQNMHVKGLFDSIVDMENSVKIISYLDNVDYDTLLSQNIVFLNLVDASAVNTLIECIMRCTPIIVNPLPAVMELLGSNYPLYYKNYYEVSRILDDTERIHQGFLYIRDLDKSKFDINSFTTTLMNIITDIDNGTF